MSVSVNRTVPRIPSRIVAWLRQISLVDILFAAFLLLVSLVSYRLMLPYRGPIDEEMNFWYAVSPYGNQIGGILDFSFNPPRTLHHAYMGLAFKVFEFHFHSYLWLMPVIHWINALLYWHILRRLLAGHYWLAGSAALLLLVYPADPTRTILGMSGHAAAISFFLIALAFMLRLSERERLDIWLTGGIIVALVVSLLSYEQLILVMVVVPLVLFVYPAPGLNQYRIMVAVTWWSGLAVVALYRVGMDWFTDLHGYTFGGGRPSYAPLDLLRDYTNWFSLGAWEAWGWVLRRVRPAVALGSPAARTIPLTLTVLSVVVPLLVGWGLMLFQRRKQPAAPADYHHRMPYHAYFVLIVGGLAIAALAYVLMPIVYTAPATTDYFQNRAHYPPSLGFAIALAALVFAVCQFLFEDAPQRLKLKLPHRLSGRAAAWGIVSLLAGLSILWQVVTMQRWDADWRFKANIWRAVMDAAPGLEPGTVMVLLVPDDGSPLPAALRGTGFITPMGRILYHDPSLIVENIGRSAQVNSEIVFEEDGVILNGKHPYDRVLFLQLETYPGDDPDALSVRASAVECLPEEYAPPSPEHEICGNPGLVTDAELSTPARELLY
ncbi:MAG: hypothetical protein IT326_03055 [Anaerolineae bacterium]|nr:hypothetical protein [Anaerolineae bacterium]